MLDRLGGGEIDEHGVELDEAAGLADGEIARRALGEARLGGPAAGVGPLAQSGHNRDEAARHELAGIRPTVASLTAKPSARTSGPILARPHIGKSWRNRSTVCLSAGVQVFGRRRRARRLLA